MRQRVVVPLDGSALSEAILPVVATFTRDAGAEILLLRSIGPDDVAGAGPEAETGLRRRVEDYLAGVAGRVTAPGGPIVRRAVWYGDPAHVILNAAARDGATLIAMGTHGRGGLDRLRFGSVAERVVRQAPVPVLLVRDQVPHAATPPAPVLVPLDGSARSEAILPVVERVARPLRLPVLLLSVIEPPASTPAETVVVASLEGLAGERRAELEAYLAGAAARLAAAGVQTSTAVDEGIPAEVIRRQAEASGSALIAMSTHGRTGLGRLLLGSVAERVLRAASIPVLLWKPPSSEQPGAPGAP